MTRLFTPTLALIIAGGLAGGIALARPASSGDGADQAAAATVPADEASAGTDGATSADDPGYRTGTRTGNRGGTPPAADDSGSGSPAPPADGSESEGADGGNVAGVTVSIEDFTFAGPQSVAPGAPIEVTNLDAAAHTLTFRSGEVDTGSLSNGATATVEAPTTPGTYDFFCSIHPSMEGQITVAS